MHTAEHTVDTSRQLAAAVPPLSTAAAPVEYTQAHTHLSSQPAAYAIVHARGAFIRMHVQGTQCCLGRLETAAVINSLPATHRTSATTRPLPQREGRLLVGSLRASPTHIMSSRTLAMFTQACYCHSRGLCYHAKRTFLISKQNI